jgi:hypothetical protein
MFFSLSQVDTCNTYFHFWIPTVPLYGSTLFIYPFFTDGHVGGFQLGAIIASIAALPASF